MLHFINNLYYYMAAEVRTRHPPCPFQRVGHRIVARALHYSLPSTAMSPQVIQPAWHDMMEAIRAATTVDEVLKIHSQFLDTCLQECLLTNHEVVKVRATVHAIMHSVSSHTACPDIKG
jgi:hypothetical protein